MLQIIPENSSFKILKKSKASQDKIHVTMEMVSINAFAYKQTENILLL